MAQEKFSDFTLQSVAQIMASPQSSYFYIVGHNEFANDNIKIPFTDFISWIGSSLGAIVETGQIEDVDVYTLTTPSADYVDYDEDKVFVFVNGDEGYTAITGINVDLSQGTITFPYVMFGAYELRIVMFK